MTKRTLEIDEDPAFQRREWIAQRIGIGALALFLLAAVLGLTGSGGFFSYGDVSDGSGALRVEYERIVRRGTRCTTTLYVHRTAPGPLSFWVSAEYFDGLLLEAVVPNPETVAADGGRYVFSVKAGSPDVVVTIQTRPKNFGRVEAQIGVVDGPSVRFRQTSLF